MIKIIIQSAEVQADLEMINTKLQDMSGFLLDVGQLWSDEMAFNFATANWPPLAARTIADKIAGGYPLAPLMRTQALREAAIGGDWSASGGGGKAIAQLDLPGYGTYHIESTRFMPARDFSFIPASFDAKLADEFVGWLFI